MDHKRKLSVAWSCGLPGCEHPTPEDAQRHCDMLNAITDRERRGLFERIHALRQRIGPVDFDAVEAIRELRDGA